MLDLNRGGDIIENGQTPDSLGAGAGSGMNIEFTDSGEFFYINVSRVLNVAIQSDSSGDYDFESSLDNFYEINPETNRPLEVKVEGANKYEYVFPSEGALFNSEGANTDSLQRYDVSASNIVKITANSACTLSITFFSKSEAGSGGGTDHNVLSNLDVDSHPQYALTDGTRGAFATAEDAAKANSAMQPGDNVSELNNDSGFQTQAQVDLRIQGVVDSAPDSLDTLNELASALGDDANFSATVTSQLSGKADASHDHDASDITDFDVEVSNNADVLSANNHITDTGNPHSVTKAQVGLSNVDNTSDLDKPVSTAQGSAIDLKADATHAHTKSDITDLNDSDYATAAQGALAASALQSLPSHSHTLSDITDSGSAAGLDVGTGANEIVQLDGAGKLPALDASQLTNIPAAGGGGVSEIFSAQGSSTQSVAANTFILMETGVVEVDTGSNWDSASKKYIVPSDGQYYIHAQCLAALQYIKYFRIYIYVNGTAVIYSSQQAATGGLYNPSSISHVLDLNEDDEVQIYLYTNNSTTTYVPNQRIFNCFKLA